MNSKNTAKKKELNKKSYLRGTIWCPPPKTPLVTYATFQFKGLQSSHLTIFVHGFNRREMVKPSKGAKTCSSPRLNSQTKWKKYFLCKWSGKVSQIQYTLPTCPAERHNSHASSNLPARSKVQTSSSNNSSCFCLHYQQAFM